MDESNRPTQTKPNQLYADNVRVLTIYQYDTRKIGSKAFPEHKDIQPTG